MKGSITQPDIFDNNLFYAIINLIIDDDSIFNILEIGGSTGYGSTDALNMGCISSNRNINI